MSLAVKPPGISTSPGGETSLYQTNTLPVVTTLNFPLVIDSTGSNIVDPAGNRVHARPDF